MFHLLLDTVLPEVVELGYVLKYPAFTDPSSSTYEAYWTSWFKLSSTNAYLKMRAGFGS
jgi:hypothetical protein